MKGHRVEPAEVCEVDLDRSEAQLSEARGESVELPSGLMQDLGEAQGLASEHGDGVQGGGAVDVPDTDPAAGIDDMQTAMSDEADRLSSDRAALEAARHDAQATRAALAEPVAAVRADHRRLAEGRDEVVAERVCAEADAAAHRSLAEDEADEVVRDVGSLQSWASSREEATR